MWGWLTFLLKALPALYRPPPSKTANPTQHVITNRVHPVFYRYPSWANLRTISAVQLPFNDLRGRRKFLRCFSASKRFLVDVWLYIKGYYLAYRSAGRNAIITTKYSVVSFVPKTLIVMFSRYVNAFFLFFCSLQVILYIFNSDTFPAYVLPLSLITLLFLVKEAIEDTARHLSDYHENMRPVQCFIEGRLVTLSRKSLAPGMVVKVNGNEDFAADMILLNCSNAFGIANVKTQTLDGEANLKQKYCLSEVQKHFQNDAISGSTTLHILFEPPCGDLYNFTGSVMDSQGWATPLTVDQILLRETTLVNTEWILGCVVYVGADTRIQRNGTLKPRQKWSRIEKAFNSHVFTLSFFLIGVAILYAALSRWVSPLGTPLPWYLMGIQKDSFLSIFVSQLIRGSTIVPVDAIPLQEVIRWLQNKVLHSNTKGEGSIKARNTQSLEEVGAITDVWTDKTGTLTENKMRFCAFSMGMHCFSSAGDRSIPPGPSSAAWRTIPELEALFAAHVCMDRDAIHNYYAIEATSDEKNEAYFFFLTLSVAHSVLCFHKHSIASPQPTEAFVDTQRGITWQRLPLASECTYNAPSPDESALVWAARYMGIEFVARPTMSTVELLITSDFALEIFLGDRIRRVFPGVAVSLAALQPYCQVMAQTLGVAGDASTRWVPMLHYTLMDMLEFDSERRRMSVLVEDREGKVYLLAKGADDAMFNATTASQDLNIFSSTLSRFATEGLRTLVMGYRPIALADAVVVRDALKAARQLFNETDRSIALNNCILGVERELKLVGCTGIEDRLQVDVKATLDALKAANLRIWMVTGDKVETATNIAFATGLLNDDAYNAILSGTNNAELGARLKNLRDYQIDTKDKPSKMGRMWQNVSTEAPSQEALFPEVDYGPPILYQGSIPSSHHPTFSEGPLERLDVYERFASAAVCNLPSCVVDNDFHDTEENEDVENQSSDVMGVPYFHTVEQPLPLLQGDTSVMVDENENLDVESDFPLNRQISKGKFSFSGMSRDEQTDEQHPPPELLTTNLCITMRRGGLDGTQHTNSSQFQVPRQFPSYTSQYSHFNLIVDGDALTAFLSNSIQRAEFFRTALLARAIVICRATPRQKSFLVEYFASFYPHSVILAVGDGANDVGMIKAAHVGVGIWGEEGPQAANAADFSIKSFFQLRRLLFVHGAEAHRKNKMILHFQLFRGILFAVTELLFSAVSGFSGAEVYNIWIKQFFTLFFMSSIILYGFTDQFLPHSILLQAPLFYGFPPSTVWPFNRDRRGRSAHFFFSAFQCVGKPFRWLWQRCYSCVCPASGPQRATSTFALTRKEDLRPETGIECSPQASLTAFREGGESSSLCQRWIRKIRRGSPLLFGTESFVVCSLYGLYAAVALVLIITNGIAWKNGGISALSIFSVKPGQRNIDVATIGQILIYEEVEILLLVILIMSNTYSYVIASVFVFQLVALAAVWFGSSRSLAILSLVDAETLFGTFNAALFTPSVHFTIILSTAVCLLPLVAFIMFQSLRKPTNQQLVLERIRTGEDTLIVGRRDRATATMMVPRSTLYVLYQGFGSQHDGNRPGLRSLWNTWQGNNVEITHRTQSSAPSFRTTRDSL